MSKRRLILIFGSVAALGFLAWSLFGAGGVAPLNRFINPTIVWNSASGQPFTNSLTFGPHEDGLAGGGGTMFTTANRHLIRFRYDVYPNNALYFGYPGTDWQAITWDVQGAGYDFVSFGGQSNTLPRFTWGFGDAPGLGQDAGMQFLQSDPSTVDLEVFTHDLGLTGLRATIFAVRNNPFGVWYGSTNYDASQLPVFITGSTITIRSNLWLGAQNGYYIQGTNSSGATNFQVDATNGLHTFFASGNALSDAKLYPNNSAGAFTIITNLANIVTNRFRYEGLSINGFTNEVAGWYDLEAFWSYGSSNANHVVRLDIFTNGVSANCYGQSAAGGQNFGHVTAGGIRFLGANVGITARFTCPNAANNVTNNGFYLSAKQL